MSNQSFDNASNRSGSRYSGSYSNNRSGNRSNPNRSVRSQQPLPPKDLDISNEISYIQPHFEKPLATSQPTTGPGNNHFPQQQQNSLLNYFSQNPPQDEEVDIGKNEALKMLDRFTLNSILAYAAEKNSQYRIKYYPQSIIFFFSLFYRCSPK